MNPLVETGIITAAVTLSAVFVIRRILRTFRSKRPSCCEGGAPGGSRKGACPRCAKK
jgi:hypothetical protein